MVHTFRKAIGSKINIKVRLEFELAYTMSQSNTLTIKTRGTPRKQWFIQLSLK